MEVDAQRRATIDQGGLFDRRRGGPPEAAQHEHDQPPPPPPKPTPPGGATQPSQLRIKNTGTRKSCAGSIIVTTIRLRIRSAPAIFSRVIAYAAREEVTTTSNVTVEETNRLLSNQRMKGASSE